MKYRLNADQLADLLNGRWATRPPDEWKLNKLLSAQRLGRRHRAQSGTLCYPDQSGKALKRMERVKDASVHVAVISDEKAGESIGTLPVLRVDDLTRRYVVAPFGSEGLRAGASLTKIVGYRTRSPLPGRAYICGRPRCLQSVQA